MQASIGAAAGRTRAPAARARQRQWTTTDRLSIFWRGRLVLHDRAYDWRPWLTTALPALTRQLLGAPQASAPPMGSAKRSGARRPSLGRALVMLEARRKGLIEIFG